jgi:hypothetical protein
LVRLSSGNRAEVSRVVKNTVRQAYHGNAGQADPSTSTRKLQATAQAWQRKGFDPTDKSTWNRSTTTGTITLAPDFTWTPQELEHLAQMQLLLHTDVGTVASAVRHVLRMVKGHQGEIAVGLVKQVLADGKQRRGRARTYGVGEAMLHKFQPVVESGAKVLPLLPNTNTNKNLYITSHCHSLCWLLLPAHRGHK